MQCIFSRYNLPTSVVYKIIQYIPCFGLSTHELKGVDLYPLQHQERKRSILAAILTLNELCYRQFYVYIPLKDKRLYDAVDTLLRCWQNQALIDLRIYALDIYGLQLYLHTNVIIVTFRDRVRRKKIQISCEDLFKHERSKSRIRLCNQAPG